MTTVATEPSVRLGLRENLAQFSLLVAVNATVNHFEGSRRQASR